MVPVLYWVTPNKVKHFIFTFYNSIVYHVWKDNVILHPRYLCNSKNKHWSDLVNGRITPSLFLPVCNYMFWLGVWPSNLTFLWVSATSFNTVCDWNPQVYDLPNGIWICWTF